MHNLNTANFSSVAQYIRSIRNKAEYELRDSSLGAKVVCIDGEISAYEYDIEEMPYVLTYTISIGCVI